MSGHVRAGNAQLCISELDLKGLRKAQKRAKHDDAQSFAEKLAALEVHVARLGSFVGFVPPASTPDASNDDAHSVTFNQRFNEALVLASATASHWNAPGYWSVLNTSAPAFVPGGSVTNEVCREIAGEHDADVQTSFVPSRAGVASQTGSNATDKTSETHLEDHGVGAAIGSDNGDCDSLISAFSKGDEALGQPPNSEQPEHAMHDSMRRIDGGNDTAYHEVANKMRIAGLTAAQAKLTDIAGLGFEPSQLCKFVAIELIKHLGSDLNIEEVVDDVGQLLARNSRSLDRTQIAELCGVVQQSLLDHSVNEE